MSTPPRILLLSAIGISLYLGLSLYHGHQLNKNPDLKPRAGKAEEKTWVQVSTTEQVAAGPVQPREAQQKTNAATGESDGPRLPASAREHQQNSEPATTTEDPMALLAALRTELLQARTLLLAREDELRQARLRLERVQEEKQRPLENGHLWRESPITAQPEQDRQLTEIDRLQAELKEARARAAIAENELDRARLKAEAMFRYGQEQSRLLAPARQETEILKTRLRDMNDKLRQTEQQVTDLNQREQQLRKELHAPRGAGDEIEAPAPPTTEKNEPTPAAERAD